MTRTDTQLDTSRLDTQLQATDTDIEDFELPITVAGPVNMQDERVYWLQRAQDLFNTAGKLLASGDLTGMDKALEQASAAMGHTLTTPQRIRINS